MWEYNYGNVNDESLSHHGVVGMKWGVHRAKFAATKSGVYKSLANQHASDSKAAAKTLNDNAKKAKSISKNSKHKLGRQMASSHAKLNSNKAKSIVKEGTRVHDIYAGKAAKQAAKAKSLASKYGDAATKKKVNQLIQSNSKKKFTTMPLYDSTDPVVQFTSDAVGVLLEK